jgi:biopolymer transport protein ExbD
MRLNKLQMTDATLTEQLELLITKQPELEVQVDADTAVPYGRVAQMMAIAQRAGVTRLTFVSNVTH